jgi:hypothetical protein
MTGSGDDEHDDEGLTSSLRSVWLAMPDEEPPESGLAALLAAARVKASEMAATSAATTTAVADDTARGTTSAAPEAARPASAPRGPSLWQRFLMLLRRPPVFALASVALVVGGLVLLGQRTDQHELDAPAVHAERRPTAPAQPVADPGAPEDHASGIEAAGELGGVAADRVNTAEPGTAVQRAPMVKTTQRAQGEHTTRATKTAQTETIPQAAKPENKSDNAAPQETTELRQDMQPAKSDEAATSTATHAERPRGAASTAGAGADPGASTSSVRPLTRLQAEARAAAAAGNCAAMRARLEQIANRDAALAGRIRAEPAIARCLGAE